MMKTENEKLTFDIAFNCVLIFNTFHAIFLLYTEILNFSYRISDCLDKSDNAFYIIIETKHS